MALQYEYLKSSSPKDAFLPSLVEIGSLVLEKKISKIRQCIFTISYLSSLGKTAEHIIKKKIKSSSPKDAKFALNWAIGSGEEDFYTLLIYFHYLLIISP